MMSSRALPDDFTHPLTYSSLQSPVNNVHSNSGRFNGPQPLSVNVPGRDANRISTTTSPTTTTPAMGAFSFANSAEIRSPVSGGGQYVPFGYRSLGVRPMASPGLPTSAWPSGWMLRTCTRGPQWATMTRMRDVSRSRTGVSWRLLGQATMVSDGNYSPT